MWRTLQGARKTLCYPVTLCLFGLVSANHSPRVLGLCDGSAVRITSGERKTVICGHNRHFLRVKVLKTKIKYECSGLELEDTCLKFL